MLYYFQFTDERTNEDLNRWEHLIFKNITYYRANAVTSVFAKQLNLEIGDIIFKYNYFNWMVMR